MHIICLHVKTTYRKTEIYIVRGEGGGGLVSVTPVAQIKVLDYRFEQHWESMMY